MDLLSSPSPYKPNTNYYQGWDLCYTTYYNGIVEENDATKYQECDYEFSPLLLLLIEEATFIFGVNRSSYCMTNKDAGVCNKPEYFEIGMVITQRGYLVKAATKELKYANFWHKDERYCGLHECPYEYYCMKTASNCLGYDLSVRNFTVSSQYGYTENDAQKLVNTGDTSTIYESVISSKNYPDYSIGTSNITTK